MARMANEDIAEVLAQIARVSQESVVDGQTALTACKTADIITSFLEDRTDNLIELYQSKIQDLITV